MSGRHPYIPNRPGSVKGKIGSMVAFKQYASAMSCANFRRLRTFMLSEGSDPGDGETGRRGDDRRHVASGTPSRCPRLRSCRSSKMILEHLRSHAAVYAAPKRPERPRDD